MAQHAASLTQYYVTLRDHPIYGAMWTAELLKQFSQWLTFLALYTKIQELSPTPAVSLSLFLLSRRLPYVLTVGATGSLSDAVNRGLILSLSTTLMAIISACFVWVQSEQQLWLLYLLASVQWAAQSFYDPARCASIMTVVPACQVHIAAALDTMCYSLMAVLGGAVGAALVQAYGPSCCFLSDSACSLVAALLLVRLVPRDAARVRGKALAAAALVCRQCCAAAGERHGERFSSCRRGGSRSVCTWLGVAGAGGQAAGALAEPLLACDDAAEVEVGVEVEVGQQLPSPAAAAGAPGRPLRQAPAMSTSEPSDAGQRHQQSPTVASSPTAAPAAPAPAQQHAPALATLWAGLAYLAQPGNADLALLTLAKGSAALVWGAADVINGRLASQASMQSLGDASATLACLMAAVGIGCIAGPLLGGLLVPATAAAWRWALSGHVVLMAAAYAVLAVAPDIYWVLGATFLRTVGANNLWVDSTALMQLRIDEAVKGHVFAIELTLYTVSEGGSAFLAGWLLDEDGVGVQQLGLGLAGLAVVLAALWLIYAWVFRRTELA